MSTKTNVIANVVGRVWGALMSFAFVPFYVRFLGVEGYGLIGFFTSMLAVFAVLDLGLSLTLNRELARLGADDDGRRTARTLVRTLELIYWAIGLLICLSVTVAAPVIASRWLNVQHLPAAQTIRAVQLMGVVAMFRWPVALYSGALMGLRRQVTLNAVTGISATLQGGGAVLVLWLWSPSVAAFFGWQVFVSLAQIAALVWATWRNLPLPLHRPRFGGGVLRSVAGFSAGITGITLLSAILSQGDKFVLSKLLPLEQFGFYALAGAIGSLLIPAGGAIYAAVFPVFVSLVASEDTDRLRAMYHKSCQLLSVVVVPAGIFIAFFSPDLLLAYFHDPRIVTGVSTLLRLQVIGNLFLALVMLPLALQLSFGWTKLSFYKNVVAVLIYIPMLMVVVGRFGAVGAASMWIAVTLGYFLIEVQVMHAFILKGEQWRWYFVDVGVPAVVSLVLAGVARLILGVEMPLLARLFVIAAGGGIALAVSALLLPGTRQLVLSTLTGLRGRLAARRSLADPSPA